ncbi:MAG: hypothetical protein ACYDH3_02720 [Candidatus Aminicenantales bacterium]
MTDGKRSGEKAGWVLGWLGGFLWVAALAVIFLAQGRTTEGILGLALTGIAVLFIFVFVPWRRPAKAYGTLMLPIYLVFFAAAAWAIRSYGGLKASGLKWWNLFMILPLLIPLGIMGGRKWEDGDRPGGAGN